jgi:hypothetical protein
MWKLFSLALALIFLTAFSELSFAQRPKETEPAAGKTMDQSSSKMMTGKVSQVNKLDQTFVIVSKGKTYRFTFQKNEWPRVGQVVDVTYVQNPDGAMEATSLNPSQSNAY